MADLINLLLTIEADDYRRRKRELIYYKPNDTLPTMEDLSRHKKGLQIPDIDCDEIKEALWSVKSQKKSDMIMHYRIQRISDSCNKDNCNDKCLHIACTGLCEHLYACSCDDRVSLCKHVHKVHSVVCRRPTIKIDEEFDPQVSELSTFHHTTGWVNVLKDIKKNDLERFKNNMETLDQLMKNDVVRKFHLKSVNNNLQDIIMYVTEN